MLRVVLFSLGLSTRLSSSCPHKRITSARTSVLWVQRLPRRCLVREVFLFLGNTRTTQVLQRIQLARITL